MHREDHENIQPIAGASQLTLKLVEEKIPSTEKCKVEAVYHWEKCNETERNQVHLIEPIIFTACG